MARGLEAAHEAGVVHRDLKPANIMISGEGDNLYALIMDFGISASTADKISGGVTGTLEYMAPEQATTGPVDARADIYAFGLILYEMLIGERPRRPGPPMDRLTAMKRRLAEGLPAIRSMDASVPDALSDVVMRCLERAPGARYQTSSALVSALAALDDQGEPIPIAPRFNRGVIAASLLSVAAAVGGTWWLTRTPPPPKQHEPVSVVIADFHNATGDPAFNGTLEPTLRLALEDSSFITAYDSSANQPDRCQGSVESARACGAGDCRSPGPRCRGGRLAHPAGQRIRGRYYRGRGGHREGRHGGDWPRAGPG